MLSEGRPGRERQRAVNRELVLDRDPRAGPIVELVKVMDEVEQRATDDGVGTDELRARRVQYSAPLVDKIVALGSP